jgi:hypothetical protein
LCKTGELLGGFFRQRLASFPRLQPFRIAEHPFEALPLIRFIQIIKRKLVSFPDSPGLSGKSSSC